MAGTIILWIVAVITAIWTLNWLVFRKMSRGHFWAIFEVVLLWAIVVYFFGNPQVSRLHVLWAAPIAYVLGFVLSIVIGRATRRATEEINP